MFFDESGIKTIRLPVIVINGDIKYYYGGDLPKLEEGVIGDLIIPSKGVTNEELHLKLHSEETIQILQKDHKLLVLVRLDDIPETEVVPRQIITNDIYLPINYNFVEVILLEPLKLLLRATKKASLKETKCLIPVMDQEVQSLNTAYTKISEKYEPKRRSHTGNVFEKCLYYSNSTKKWETLDRLRNIEESKYQERLFLDDRMFILTDNNDNAKELRDEEKLVLLRLKMSKKVSGKEIRELLEPLNKDYIEVINNLIGKFCIQHINK